MADMAGAKVVLLEARMNSELANLVRRHGGDPVSVPAVREVTVEDAVSLSAEVGALIDDLHAGSIDLIIFQTGVGVMRLCEEAEKLNRKEELLEAVRRTMIAARGPKPTAELARHGLKPEISIKEPYTTAELCAALETIELAGKTVVILHYGERNSVLIEALLSRGARLRELCLYEWKLPEDLGPLKSLIDRIINEEFAAIAFTSQIQARHLFQLATEAGKEGELREALKQMIVASVGPTSTSVLRSLGVEPDVEPLHPKMGPMVLALAEQIREI
ncbi:MAG: uroporphyrinogen-III synthase [Blastocatellia bacterium]|nr:uroporphyrinogen-III synthase [Blastocatellia bacterium]